ncbi:hypothetical protein BU23DRAFT_560053 [Bimuria novae-zelandiae CBS 107.79]|uniref:Ribosomal RNA-processing protein 7 n=1 Tax=Bimuria novae-zelandiae CBS 107.79 TaxID=1447943 RepID=A0A6A5V002_9PLEO|nr:hypothetical protein BU23DRAFT_560053 [Bimuria novae-zelandiae CBS 107.79]
MSHLKSPNAKKSTSPPKSVANFEVLPLSLPAQPGRPSSCADARHYIYVKPHAPSQTTASTPRSLFIANVPIDASEANLRALFADQLGGARVESVEFDASVPAVVEHKRFKLEELLGGENKDTQTNRGTKRKREDGKSAKKEMVAEGVVEDEDSALPRIWNGELRRSGSGAVVVFLDKASMRGAFEQVQKAVKEGKTVRWIGGEALGVERYKSHLTLVHPAASVLSTTTNAYLAQFDAAEDARNRALAHLRSVPDEDGFITVTRRGGRSAPAARLEIAQQKQAELDERKKKKGSLDGFYRFQNREKRKEEENRLKKQFEKDRRRVQEMRERRGKVRLES